MCKQKIEKSTCFHICHIHDDFQFLLGHLSMVFITFVDYITFVNTLFQVLLHNVEVFTFVDFSTFVDVHNFTVI